MATWPDNLPGPMRAISVQAGSNLVSRAVQSGRREIRRFGSGAPDKVTVQFRLFNTDVAAFEYFFNRTANLGINWFTADWLPAMGYSSHSARILGYPKRKAAGAVYSDYSVTLLIMETVYCPEDTAWLSGRTGSESGGSSGTEGVVGVWGYGTAGAVANAPAESISAVKVVLIMGINGAVALKADGTVTAWGTATALGYISGYASLGSIVDIIGCYYGFLYITETGVIGWCGSTAGVLDTDIPTSGGVSKLVASPVPNVYARAFAFFDDLSITGWGSSLYDFSSPASAAVRSVGTDYRYSMHYVDVTDDLYVCGTSHIVRSSIAEISCAATYASGTTTSSAWYIIGYKTDGSWYTEGHSSIDAFYPSGLVPTEILCGKYAGAYSIGAIHTDGTLLFWSPNSLGETHLQGLVTDYGLANVKVHQAEFYSSKNSSTTGYLVVVGIQRED